MTQPNTSNQIKRGLVGGLISAVLGAGCFSLFLYEGGSRLQGVLMFVCLGFGFPALMDLNSSNFIYILRVAIFWFLTGGIIGYFARNNKVTIGIWLLVYAVSSAVSIALFANMMN
jgi:hypothetical protein